LGVTRGSAQVTGLSAVDRDSPFTPCVPSERGRPRRQGRSAAEIGSRNTATLWESQVSWRSA
jgi:hypothetical protein